MPRWYVTATWDDWPEGGSYGNIVEADTYYGAIEALYQEMAETRCDPNDGPTDEDRADPSFNPKDWASEPEFWRHAYEDEWHIVDCFDVDAFIKDNQRVL